MEVNFNYDSKTSRFYKWFYGIDNYKMPKNLCLYFWGLVFAVIWTICGGFILAIPTLLIEFFTKEKSEVNLILKSILGILISIVVFFILSAVLFIISFIYNSFHFKGFWFEPGGVVASGYLLLFCLVYLINKISKKKKEPTLFSSFIQAKKEKICPKINWYNGNISSKENPQIKI